MFATAFLHNRTMPPTYPHADFRIDAETVPPSIRRIPRIVRVRGVARVRPRGAVTIKYLGNRRDASFPDLGTRTQSRGTFGIFYTLLGQEGFGNVDWHN